MNSAIDWLLKTLVIFWIFSAIPGAFVLLITLLFFPPQGVMVLIYGIFAVSVLVGCIRWCRSKEEAPGSKLLLLASLALWLIPFLACVGCTVSTILSAFIPNGRRGALFDGWTELALVSMPLAWFTVPIIFTTRLWWISNKVGERRSPETRPLD
ncbi:hypothetical protein BH09VER1_BH09VER1_16810 [soil metagenome]